MTVSFQFESRLAAPPAVVWAHCSSMAGVNAELAPLSMTHPAHAVRLDGAAVPLGQVLFRSWVLLWGLLPLDRHALCLTELTEGEGFHEESTTWLQRRWVHDRRLRAEGSGCTVVDRVSFTPRLPLVERLVTPIVRTTFARRHRYLRRRFGERPKDP